MRIICWNVAGIRACLKRGSMDFLGDGKYDIVCIQETKALESEVEISEQLRETYPFRYWNSCKGEGGQKKGLSGTAIWSKRKAMRQLPVAGFDNEGRITAVEFGEFNLVTVYTPNSQSPVSERCQFRTKVWDKNFREYVSGLNKIKPTIICGDFNVANEDIDVYKPDEWRNAVAGFLDNERNNFKALLAEGFVDAYRERHPGAERRYTFWDQKLPFLRKSNRGWRIDYFLVPQALRSRVKGSGIHSTTMGSDHCPITLTLETKRRLEIQD